MLKQYYNIPSSKINIIPEQGSASGSATTDYSNDDFTSDSSGDEGGDYGLGWDY
jgi:hypothetical protein